MRGCRPLSHAEIEAVLNHLENPKKKRERALFLIGIRTGLKITSILSLRIEDISVGGRVCDSIRVRQATTKDRQARFYTLRLHPQIVESLQQYLDSRKGVSGYVFKGRYAYTHLKRIQGWRLIRDVFRELNISGGHGELGSECMRKTYGRLCHAALGQDWIKTKYAMRHADIISTFRYFSFIEEDVDAAILAL